MSRRHRSRNAPGTKPETQQVIAQRRIQAQTKSLRAVQAQLERELERGRSLGLSDSELEAAAA